MVVVVFMAVALVSLMVVMVVVAMLFVRGALGFALVLSLSFISAVVLALMMVPVRLWPLTVDISSRRRR